MTQLTNPNFIDEHYGICDVVGGMPVVAHIDQSGADDCDLLVLLRHCLGRLLFYSSFIRKAAAKAERAGTSES